MVSKFWWINFFLLVFFVELHAQEQLGLRQDNYVGINGVLINPAKAVTSPFAWDVNIFSAGIHLDNNYAYLKDESIFSFLKKSGGIRSAHQLEEFELGSDEVYLDYFDKDRVMYMTALTDVMGPSVMIKLNSQHSIGLFSRVRALLNVPTIPYAYGFYEYSRRPYFENFVGIKSSMGAMAWTEIGLNYATSLETVSGSLSLGGSIKFLQGYEAVFLRNPQSISLTKLPVDSLQFGGATLEAGFTTSNINSNELGPTNNGIGFGLDVGLEYIIGAVDDYQLKLGVSILDIGKIKFSENAERHLVDTDETYIIPYATYDDLVDLDDFMRRHSFDALGDSLASFDGSSFSMWLPGGLSLQADYALAKNYYLNATLVQRIPIPGGGVQRNNILAVTPRYESRWYSAAVPLVFYNWKQVQLGASVRIAFLSIGTDNLLSFFRQSELTGSDFYIGLKLNPFELGNFGFLGGGQNAKGARCYEF